MQPIDIPLPVLPPAFKNEAILTRHETNGTSVTPTAPSNSLTLNDIAPIELEVATTPATEACWDASQLMEELFGDMECELPQMSNEGGTQGPDLLVPSQEDMADTSSTEVKQ